MRTFIAITQLCQIRNAQFFVVNSKAINRVNSGEVSISIVFTTVLMYYALSVSIHWLG